MKPDYCVARFRELGLQIVKLEQLLKDQQSQLDLSHERIRDLERAIYDPEEVIDEG